MINLNELTLGLTNGTSELSYISKKLIREFYEKLRKSDSNIEFYKSNWRKEFKFIYGDINNNFSGNKKIKPNELAKIYSINTEEDEELDILDLFFAIQTFYRIFIVILAYKILKLVKKSKVNSENRNVTEFLSDLLDGTFFDNIGITDFSYPDWYFWVIENVDEEIISDLTTLINILDKYETIDNLNDFSMLHNNDNIKQIYEIIIPQQLRHALGEYYTPDWLALYTINQTVCMDKTNNIMSSKTFLDPTCGSGTFLFKTIQKIRNENTSIKLEELLSSIRGFDLNPIAVITAKTNYLISVLDLINENTVLKIPVYNFDVINTPRKQSNGNLIIDINADSYEVPLDLIGKNYSKFKLSTKNSISNKTRVDAIHNETFNEYSNEKFRSIMVPIIFNRIEACQLDKVDYVIGNPPWVNWEYLPKDYREKSQYLWIEYGLFGMKGLDLSFSKEDISVLVTYSVIDKFLKDKGYLGFIIGQGLFKSEKNGVGFRRFQVGYEYNLEVKKVDDLSAIKPFENATNNTSIVYIQKNSMTKYPIPYSVWTKKTKRDKLKTYDDLEDILNKVKISNQIAFPSDKNNETSLWINIPEETISTVNALLGTNEYNARTGVFTGGANAVYWLEIENRLENGNLQVSNIVERAKRKVEKVHVELEPDLVYPIVKGSDIGKWDVSPSTYILVPHTSVSKMNPINEFDMQRDFPLTIKYLSGFRNALDSRKGFAGWEKEIQKNNFHAILRIGDYTFSKFKVAWRYIATEFISVVLEPRRDKYLGEKNLIPNEKVMYISTDNEDEAYYLCGILSSDPIAFCVKSYMNPTSISTHVLSKLQIESYDENNDRHREIAVLCKTGHKVKQKDERKEILSHINNIVAKIYDINTDQMSIISKALVTNKD